MSFINPNNSYREYVTMTEDNEEKLEEYKVYIYLEEDDYARYDVENVTDKPVVKMVNDLQKLPPLGLFKTKETVKVRLYGYLNKNTLEKIVNYVNRGREFIFEVKNDSDLGMIKKLVKNLEDSELIKVFDKKDFHEEIDWCREKVEEWGTEVPNSLKGKIAYYMRNNHDKWNDVKLMFDIEGEIDEEIVGEYFDDLDSYNIEEWVDSVILGNKKGKNIVILDYLINIKGIKPYFILERIKKRLELYLELINLYKLGIIHGKETSISKMVDRAEFLGITVSEDLQTNKRDKMISKLDKNLGIIKESEVMWVYTEVIKVINSKNKYTINSTDLVILIDNIRLSKTKERLDEINKGMFKLSKRR